MSHDLVELYFGRRLHPRLQPIIESSEKPDPNADRRVISRVVLSLVNLGGQLGREVLTRIVWLPNRALWLSVERVIVGTHHFDESKSAEGNVVSVPHHGELYYPGVPKEVVTINFNSSLDTIGSDKSIFFLDVYAADSRPYRYSFYRTFQEDAEWKVRWEAAGLPPFAA